MMPADIKGTEAASQQEGWQIQVARSALLSEVVLLMARTPDLQRLLNQLVNKVKWVLDFERATLALLNDDEESYRLQTLLETRRTIAKVNVESVPLDQGIPGAVIRSRQVQLLTNLPVERDKYQPVADPALWDGSLATILALPLQAYGKVVGVLTFATTKPDGYSSEDIKIAVAIATHLALSIDRWQQTQQLQQANEELARLASFPQLNPGPITEVDLEGNIHYLNPAGEALFPECREAGKSHPLMIDLPQIIGHLHEDGQNTYLREIEIDQTWYQQVFHRVPNSQRVRFYVIDITERKRTEEAMHRQNEYLAALHETTLGLISRFDVNELLHALITRAAQLLETPHGFMFLLEPDTQELEQKVGIGIFARADGFRLKKGEGVSGRVWQTGESLVITDYDAWEHRAANFERNQVKVVMAVPLKSGNQIIGTIGMAYGVGSDQGFGPAEVQLLNRFAELASLALDNAHLFNESQQARAAAEDQAQRLALLNEMGKLMNLASTQDEIFKVITYYTPQIVAADRVSVALLRQAEDSLQLFALQGEAGIVPIGKQLPLDGTLLGKAVTSQELVYAANLSEADAIDARAMVTQGLQSSLIAPLFIGERVLGTLNIGSKQPGVYISRDKSLLMQIAAFLTTTLENRRLFDEAEDARAAAVAANDAKSAFLATMSHEIRTPMNAIIGMTSLLLDTPQNEEQRDFTETIRSSSEALLTIINDILDFSKIEAGKLELEQQPFDVRESLEGALDLLTSRAAEKGLELAYIIAPHTPEAILGDVTRLRQILVNLLSNALKFTDQGEVVIEVNALEKKTDIPASRAMLQFSVRDTGLGIPPDRMDRLFHSFSQVDASTTRRYGGTGLGLAISKRLSQLMGGDMWVESSGIPGQGTTFYFTIQAEITDLPARAFLREPQPEFAGKRLLIVDDNATNRRILILQAQSWQMTPVATESPLEALKWIREGRPFDVAVLDMHMPDMDGLTLANHIKQEPAGIELPLVMLTSLGGREAMREADDQPASFAAFLTKPIKPSHLFNVLAAILNEQSDQVVAQKTPARSQFDNSMGQQHPLHILLAEDHPTNQKLALRLLDRLGYRADVAANGLEVLAAVKRQHYDIVLMDMQMPELDGLETTRRIRRQEAENTQEHLRIVAMTANAMQGDRELCLAAGMDDYVSKPIRIEALVEALYNTPAHEREEAHSEAHDAHHDHDSSAADVLDKAKLDDLLEMTGGDPEFLTEMIDSYLETTPPLLEKLEHSLAQNDAADFRLAAHTLKSGSADFGALRLSKLCAQMEGMGKNDDLEGALSLVEEAKVLYRQVEAALTAVKTAY